MNAREPIVVIVSGAPGSGKTTLAGEIGAHLGWPLFCRDTFKEAIMDAIPVDTLEMSYRIGVASYAVLFTITRQLLGTGTSCIVESNFSHGRSEVELSALGEPARLVQVHCSAPFDIVVQRYADRVTSGERHLGHHDAERIEELKQNLAAGRYEPLDLDCPVIAVDTTDGFNSSTQDCATLILKMSVANRND